MSDYSHKNIPTLNDIIEKDLDNNDKAETKEAEATENIHDRFSAELVDADTATEAETGDVNDITEVESAYEESAASFSANNTEDIEYIVNTLLSDTRKDNDNEDVTHEHAAEAIPQVPAEAVKLEYIVNDIVEQLMPDLEQQLRKRLQQLLQEKLPEEIFGPADTAADDQSTL